MSTHKRELRAGAAVADITPTRSAFLWGYPHVERYSTGVHDPLLSSALYLSDGNTEILIVANDVGLISKATANRARQKISETTGVPFAHIMITATHTHSAPATVDLLGAQADPVVPPADPAYLRHLEDGILYAALGACRASQPARIGLSVAEITGTGGNRRDPSGPCDPQVPVLAVQSADGEKFIAAMLICCMHPTVLHEDSTQVSGDFPGMARLRLQETVLGLDCPVLWHTGPAGNQSPRHAVSGNTFEEACRLGQLVSDAVKPATLGVRYESQCSLAVLQSHLVLPARSFPAVAQAQADLDAAAAHLQKLRTIGGDRFAIRTAECDWFGAQEALTLAQAAESGRLETVVQTCMPAEIQVITIGPWRLVGWPGEIFVEYGLAVKANSAGTYVISLANGELQGYIATPQAARQGGYEASNALFAPESGDLIVQETLRLLQQTT